MTTPSIDADSPMPAVSFWQRAATVLLILGFIAAAGMRLNDCDLLNPDSPRYLIYGQSLAQTGEYRAIDTPGAPLYTWRPPGLPILLAPVLRSFPYDVVAAKCVVLLTAALLLLAVHAIASMTSGGWSGPLMVAVVGSSPLFLSLGTEVLTEVPYALGTLAVLYGIARWDGKGNRHRSLAWTVAACALAFTPIVRTVGVALVASVGLWSIAIRRRWKFLPAVALAVAGLGWLAWRSRQAPGTNYAGSLLHSIQEQGLPAVTGDALRTLVYYASAFPGVLLPGLTSEQPFFAPMVVGPLPSLTGLDVPAAVAALGVTLLGVAGLWRRRAYGGTAGLIYLALYCACLAIWPWRHERFLWPLVPVIWAFVPAGCTWTIGAVPSNLRPTIQSALVVVLAAYCGWQSLTDAALISTNRQFLADREQFYARQAPGFYFSDWRQAGRWIRDNTPPHARLLTWQAAVGGTAHRFQRRVQFEALSPEKVRQQIAGFCARYLVITDAQFGLGFGWQQVFADPGYSLNVIYQDRGVTVLEVGPNRDGKVSRTGHAQLLQAQRAALEQFLSRWPDRPDLIARQADLLQEAGQTREAIALLESLVERGMVTVRVCSSLGWLYFAEQDFERAARYLDLARGLPNAEPVAAALADGARRARQRLVERDNESVGEDIDRSLRRIEGQVAALNFAAAEREVDSVLPRAPENAELNYWKGYLHHLFGEQVMAVPYYTRAARSGSNAARDKLTLLRWEHALRGDVSPVASEGEATEPVDPDAFASHVRLARLYDEQGWSGRALATLESARRQFGDQPEILSPLAELYLRFARPEEAAPLFRLAQQAWPHEKSLRQGLAAAEAALRVPTY